VFLIKFSFFFFFLLGTMVYVGRVAQSVLRLVTGWTVRGSNPGGARFSAPVQIGPGARLLYNGYRLISGGKVRSGSDADPSPTSSAVVMKG
jgi:hypothetical protein